MELELGSNKIMLKQAMQLRQSQRNCKFKPLTIYQKMEYEGDKDSPGKREVKAYMGVRMLKRTVLF